MIEYVISKGKRDGRILGSVSFLEQLQQETQNLEIKHSSVSLKQIIQRVSRIFSIEPASLRQGNKLKTFSDLRGALCYIAVVKMGVNAASVARILNISRSGISLAASRGKEIYKTNSELNDIVASLKN